MTLEELVALQLRYHELLGSGHVPPRTGTITGEERQRRRDLAEWARSWQWVIPSAFTPTPAPIAKTLSIQSSLGVHPR